MTSQRNLPPFIARVLVVSLGVAAAAAIVPSLGGPTDQADAAASFVIARYDLNESAGSSVLVDSVGGLNGTIGGNVQHPVTASAGGQSGTGHRFANIDPQGSIVDPEHLDVVPDNAKLDPGTEDFAITVRFRKTASYGNILQKGQNTVTGGYFKIEMPGNTASCLFKDSAGLQSGLTSPETLMVNGLPVTLDISDGMWHVLRCERTQVESKMWVDGVEVAKTGSPTGSISNSWPLVFGGKYDCNPPAPGTTCDYFAGDIDYVQFEKGDGNKPPTAAFTPTITKNVVAFNGSASKDTDGTIASWVWDFGDGTPTAAGTNVTHTYATAGSFNVKLTVTDDDGATGTTTKTVKPTAPPATTTTSTTTTTTIVAQLPPGVLTVIPGAATAEVAAVRLPVVEATETATTVGG